MVQTIEKAATYEDLLAVPEPFVAEILFGKLVTHPRPHPRHGASQTSLIDELTGPFQKGNGGPGGWVFLVEPELHLGKHVTVPDIAGWRRERLPQLPDDPWIETAPDWACEIISPSTERYDRGEKREIYATHDVKHIWYVDPRPQILEAFELNDGKWLLLDVFKSDDDVSIAPFDAVRFSLGLLWPFGTGADEP